MAKTLRKITEDDCRGVVANRGHDVIVLQSESSGRSSFVKKHVFYFVVDMMNPDRDAIKRMAEGNKNIVIHENVIRMYELMLACEVAISVANEFDVQGIIKNCGDIRELGNECLAKKLIQEAVNLTENLEERKRISEAMGLVVDGSGAKRIVESILK